jgi:WD40 repeat protein
VNQPSDPRRILGRDSASTGTEVLSLKGHGSAVTSASFSPDGWRIVTSSHDGTAKVWDARPLNRAFPPEGLFSLDPEGSSPFNGSVSESNFRRILRENRISQHKRRTCPPTPISPRGRTSPNRSRLFQDGESRGIGRNCHAR